MIFLLFVFFIFDDYLQQTNLWIIHIFINNCFNCIFIFTLCYVYFVYRFVSGSFVFTLYNINVFLINIIFMNRYTSYSIVIMTQNYYEQIIFGHNNFVSKHGHDIDTTKVNIEVRTSLFQQLSSYIS